MMASPTAHQLTESEKRDEFHRVIALQFECVTDLLRELLDDKLLSNNISLEKYLRSCQIHLQGKKYVTKSQEAVLTSSNPDSKDMDVTMLTMILLAKCNNLISITKREKSCIERLREHRNAIAHNVTGRLNDKKLYTEISNDSLSLAKSLKVISQTNIKACIDELRHRICVRLYSKFDVLEFNKEKLQVFLVYKDENEKEQDEVFKETMLKFNLTKWARQISRDLDIHNIVMYLRQNNVITDEIVKRIEDTECECNKAITFIEFLVQEGTKIQILKFCEQLRTQKTHEFKADLIMGRSSDGQDSAKEIQQYEENRLKDVLMENLIADAKGEETCEQVHAFVEEKLGFEITFTTLNEAMRSLFRCISKDGRYEEVSIKRLNDGHEKEEKTSFDKVNVAAMSFDDYVNYVGSQFRSIGEDIFEKISSAIRNEAVQMETFVELTDEELNECFGHYLGHTTLPFGIKKKMKNLQTYIKSQLKPEPIFVKPEGSLRKFDKPFLRSYEKCEVSYSLGGDLNTPAHEFIHPGSTELTRNFVMKKVVRFISACLNARKNGTIHFGIKRTGRNKGEILGCQNTAIIKSLDEIVAQGLKRCFNHLNNCLQKKTIRCTRPAHIIQISDDDLVVAEIDVVPFGNQLDDTFFTAMFPPFGPQKEVFFLYESGPHSDIVEIEKGRVDAVKIELKSSLRERQILDAETLRNYRSASDLVQHLTDELTRGADFITDVFYPIMCTGKIEKSDFLDYHGLQDAFQNAYAVFDFGTSRTLRRKMEEGSPQFTVKTAADFDMDEKDISFTEKEKLWVYCNGYEDLGIEVLDADAWIDKRMVPLENVLRYIKRKLPILRVKVMFLVFETVGLKDPMVELAREAFIRIFKHQCMIIGESSEDLEPFDHEISKKIGNEKVNTSLFSGLSWYDVSKVFRKTFKESSDNVCKLPNSSGTYEEVTQKEKEKWKDIDILSMEECIQEEKQMKVEECKTKQKEEETKFYQGKKASWWNFHYSHHGERDLFSKLRSTIEKKLTRTDGKMLVESIDLRHEPGAGGSILGRHLIWHFSQTRCVRKPYRCCVVKQITENTVDEIDKFRQYKDTQPRPVIILLDDEPDGNMFFHKGLQQLAYKTATPGELFGIVINVSRVSLGNDPVEEAENGKAEVKNTLKHRLTDRERAWFEMKYKELEQSDVDVNTLIAFNVMRNSFDKEYIKSTVEKILIEVPLTEIDILKVLSLVSTYEIGTLVPASIFDSIVGIPITIKQSKIGEGKPYGMRRKMMAKTNRPPEILNSLSLSLFACRSGYEVSKRGLRIISQPLAAVILRYIQDTHSLSLEDIVMFILDQTERQKLKDNIESSRFVEVVCSLFKTREDSGRGKDGIKDKFSRLIVAFLDRQNANDLEDGKKSVVRVMKKCISVTGNAFVGQQLARFHIFHTKDFEEAELAICDSIGLCQNNSYLLDTYGQVFKTNMEYIRDLNCQGGKRMSNDVAKQVISLAFRAIDMFIEGQATTQEYEKDRCNLSCYVMEVRSLVGLLEIFEFFECYTNEEDLLDILLNPEIVIGNTVLSDLNENGYIEEIVIGGKRQVHVADALRFVEERDYQVKKIFTVYTAEDVLLLSLRERYERFYRSHGLKYQLKFGYGLKPLLRAFKSKDKEIVEARFAEAKRNLENFPLEIADTRDLLFFLGFSFAELLPVDSRINAKLYRQLLSYSAKLLDTQTQHDGKRPYLEAFLFYSIFHWPLKGRFRFGNLSSPNSYMRIMELWEETYRKNNYITTREQIKANKGKTYFALSKDHLGVIDLFEIEMEWREKKEREEGRSRMHVYKDYFWREPFVADQLERLTGTLDDSGTVINHVVKYPTGDHVFKIKTFYPTAQLRNRMVTFVLGFTWSGLKAFDVVEKGEESSSSGSDENFEIPEESEDVVHVKPREINLSLYQPNRSTTSGVSKQSREAQKQYLKSVRASNDTYEERSSKESRVQNEATRKTNGESENIRHKKRYQQPKSDATEVHAVSQHKPDTISRVYNPSRKNKEGSEPNAVTTKREQIPRKLETKTDPSIAQGLVVTADRISDLEESGDCFENAHYQRNKGARPKQHLTYATVASKGSTQGIDYLSNRQSRGKTVRSDEQDLHLQENLDTAFPQFSHPTFEGRDSLSVRQPTGKAEPSEALWEQYLPQENPDAAFPHIPHATVALKPFIQGIDSFPPKANAAKAEKLQEQHLPTKEIPDTASPQISDDSAYWDELMKEVMDF